jgi:hypothetical protein
MRKRIFSLIAAVSLLLCLGMIILWIVCHGKQGSKAVEIPGGRYAIVLWDGYLAVVGVDRNAFRLPNGRLGVSVPRQGPPGRIPFWILTLIFMAPPVLWLALRRPPIPPGHCQNCGYDLRATPDRCPECGTPTSKPSVLSRVIGFLILTVERGRSSSIALG